MAAAAVLAGDDTDLRVLDADKENGSKRGHMWGYVAYNQHGNPALAGFRYTPNWTRSGPGEFLVGFSGTLQCDGYKGWLSLAKNELNASLLPALAALRVRLSADAEVLQAQAAQLVPQRWKAARREG